MAQPFHSEGDNHNVKITQPIDNTDLAPADMSASLISSLQRDSFVFPTACSCSRLH